MSPFLPEDTLRIEKAEPPSSGYYVYWRDQKWGLLEPPRLDWNFTRYGLYDRHLREEVELSFRMIKLHEEPAPPKPKRTVATALGLRRPK